MPHDPEFLLEFWFGKTTEGFADSDHRALWYNGGDAFDGACRRNFEDWPRAALDGELDTWCTSPRGLLAFVIVCDQLPRNIYRGTPDAFATDPLALAAIRKGIETGLDLQLEGDERGFCYMPFEHSEDIFDQHLAVGLFTALRDVTRGDNRQHAGNYLRYAQSHRDVILRFSRFPHRNDILGRSSTPEELAYLADGGGF